MRKSKTMPLQATKPESRSKAVKKSNVRDVVIAPPKFETASILIRGTSPYVQHAFSQKAKATMMTIQESGSQGRKGKTREAKDFKAVCEAATYRSRKGGWYGIPAPAFRNGIISACRTVGFKMTLAKLSVFVEADGFDANSGTPMVKFTKGSPHMDIRPARNSNGSTDLRARPMWDEGWEAKVRIRWDAEQFSATDVVNLLSRVGSQVGVGEGRADSKMSAGCGWGHFEVVG